MKVLLTLVLCYLLGSIPFALIIGKLFYKTDVRTKGSGNLGASNTGRVLGKAAGLSVATLDVLKATVAILIANAIIPEYAGIAGIAAALGHCYPVFAGFKGGKAVSTAAGFLLGMGIVLNRIPSLLIIPAAVFFTMLKITKYVSLSSIIAVIVASVLAMLVMKNTIVNISFVIITILVIVRHRSNIKRLIDGNENKVKWI